MISNSIRPIIFHILFTAAFGRASVKILQINLSNGFNLKCDNLKCDISSSGLLNALKIIKPDVVLWLRLNGGYDLFIDSIKHQQTNTSILPILTYADPHQTCYDFPRNFNHSNCYYSIYLSNLELKFLILNTFLWLKEDKSSNSQLKWLSDELKQAEKRNERVIISGYKAPGSFELSNGSLNYSQKYNENLVDLLVKYSNTIKGCFFGEQFLDTFRIVINNEKKPVLPIFISPSNNQYIRMYTYNHTINELDNCFIYQKIQSDWKKLYDCKTQYKLTNMNASSWFKVALSLLQNNSNHFKTCANLLWNDPFKKYCKSNNVLYKKNCIKCRCHCFISFVAKDLLDNCTRKCSLLAMGKGNVYYDDDHEQNNGMLFVFAVIAGFVIILVGIVLAVNKVYCIRRGRQRNIFLAPLTLNIQSETIDEPQHQDLNRKLSISKEGIENNPSKNSNGYRRTNHEVEQTYNYIRM